MDARGTHRAAATARLAAATALAALLTVACGGGGAGGSDPPPASSGNPPPISAGNPPGTTTPPPSTSNTLAQQALAAVNDFRASPRTCGGTGYATAPPLQWNDALARAASAHASDMVARKYFSHTGLDGSTPSTRAAAQGYAGLAGENIAAGYVTLDDAMKGWIASPGHCANLMDPRYRDLGVAAASDPLVDFGLHWVQVFGLPR